MKISSNNLINLPVYNQSGDHLGQVDSFEVFDEDGIVQKVHVVDEVAIEKQALTMMFDIMEDQWKQQS